ncbi:MAG: cobyrinate a,c-diamide synthase [Alphaproteobacteria bacterium]|nr:cobyrinate a,c-diamide synthase [Alphaproteobacteria bacterium]
MTARGLVIAAPQSNSGKTLVALGLARALALRGVAVRPAKSGPDYIDPQFLARAARHDCLTLDAWAMSRTRLRALARAHAGSDGFFVVEGVMGLFDGASSGIGSTADLAVGLGLPVVLVVDCAHLAQSIAAMAEGFIRFRSDLAFAGIVLNRVASDRHEAMLRAALDARGIACLGAIRNDPALCVPDRHLGLVQPEEIAGIDPLIDRAAESAAAGIDIDRLWSHARALGGAEGSRRLPPLGQRIAVARDRAFGFVYRHWLTDWHLAGTELSFFSPLADEAPDRQADAVFLPGGYPELHGAQLAAAAHFKAGLVAARDRGALIYGECGGYMVLGQSLTDAEGITHEMAGLLPHHSRIDRPHRTLGYRLLRHQGPLPFARALSGHEFHYSTSSGPAGQQLFVAADAAGNRLGPMGSVIGRVCGSYAHVIDTHEEAP